MKKIAVITLVAIMQVAFVSPDCFAQKASKAKAQHDGSELSGTVKLVKDKDGKVAEISLTSQDGTVYKVTMNAASKELSEKDNKAVVLNGYVEEMDGAKWFTIAAPDPRAKAKEKRAENKGKKKNK